MTEHGFRKYFSTCLETEGVNPVYIELLLGHNMGLKSIYSRPTPAQLLEGNGTKVLGYVSGIDALTINEDNRLRKKVAEQEHTIQVELVEKERKIQELMKWKEKMQVLLDEPEQFIEMLQSGRKRG